MWTITALIMGLAGSIHCAGMCGPIAVIIGGKNGAASNPGWNALVYNSGRVVTYALLGSISGLAGKSVIWFAGQQWLSVIAGVIILLGLLLTQVKHPSFTKFTAPVYERLRQALGKILRKRNSGSMLYVGMLNGLLPCGLVYAAIGGAAATGGAWSGALFMAIFGAATIPMMFAISLAGSRISPTIYRRMARLVPVTIAIMAALLIVRGLGLGIPYLSPAIETGQVACCHQAH